MNPFFHLESTVPRNLPLSARERDPEGFYRALRYDFENYRLDQARKHLRMLYPLAEQVSDMAPRQALKLSSGEMP